MSRPGEVTDSVTGDAEPGLIDRVHELMARLWAAAPEVSDTDRTLFELAVVEIAGNVVRYARPAGGVRARVTVRITEDRLEAEVEDDSEDQGFVLDIRDRPDDLAEGGRGLRLVRAACDELSYRRDPSGDRWRLVRSRKDQQ